MTFTYYIKDASAPVVVTRSITRTTVLRESVNADVGPEQGSGCRRHLASTRLCDAYNQPYLPDGRTPGRQHDVASLTPPRHHGASPKAIRA